MSEIIINHARYVLDDNGHLADPATWTPAFAQAMAESEFGPLSADQWWLIHWVREYWLQYGNPPLMRSVVQAFRAHREDPGLGSAAIYALFPEHPVRQACLFGGVPKPDWCI